MWYKTGNNYIKKIISIIVISTFTSTNLIYGVEVNKYAGSADTLAAFSKMQTDVSLFKLYSGILEVADHFLIENKTKETLEREMRHKFSGKEHQIRNIDLGTVRKEKNRVIIPYTYSGVHRMRFEVSLAEDLTPEERRSDEWEMFSYKEHTIAVRKKDISNKYVFDLEEQKASNIENAGGKGANLKKIISISKDNEKLEDEDKEIITKEGYFVSTSALKEYLDALNIPEIDELEEISQKWITLEIRSNELKGYLEELDEGEIDTSKIITNGWRDTDEDLEKMSVEQLSELLKSDLKETKSELDETEKEVKSISGKIKIKMLEGKMPEEIEKEIKIAFYKWHRRKTDSLRLFVRSSGVAEDTSIKAFAGAYSSYGNICDVDELVRAVIKCWASLFNTKAVMERNQAVSEIKMKKNELGKEYKGPEESMFTHRNADLSVVVQEMVADPPASFVAFSIDRNFGRPGVRIEAVLGYGIGLVDSKADNDSWFVSEDNFEIVEKRIAEKDKKIVAGRFPGDGFVKKEVNGYERIAPSLSDEEVIKIAKKILYLKKKYNNKEIDCEGALDKDRKIFMLQARPDAKYAEGVKITFKIIDRENIPDRARKLFEGGVNAESGAVTGVLQCLKSTEFDQVDRDVILAAPYTDHNWSSQFGKILGVITDEGGMTGHAAVTAQGLGLPALVSCKNALDVLKDHDGEVITLDTVNGVIYLGRVPLKKIEEIREVWRKNVEPKKENEIDVEELWEGAEKASQTVTDADGTRWIGRPSYALRKLQYQIYERAFDMVEEGFNDNGKVVKIGGLRRRNRVADSDGRWNTENGGLLDVYFKDNCKIDAALKQLSIEKLEEINREKEIVTMKFRKLSQNFEPTREKINEFIHLYTLVNYYMDIGFQFDEACKSVMKEQLKFINKDFNGDFLRLAYDGGKTEAIKMGEDIEALAEFGFKNHLAIFTDTFKGIEELRENLKLKDPEYYNEIYRIVERYKDFGVSHLTVERPMEKALIKIRSAVAEKNLESIATKYTEEEFELIKNKLKKMLGVEGKPEEKRSIETLSFEETSEILNDIYKKIPKDKCEDLARLVDLSKGFGHEDLEGYAPTVVDQGDAPDNGKISDEERKNIEEKTATDRLKKITMFLRYIGKTKGEKTKSKNTDGYIRGVLNNYPDLKRALRLSVKAKHITENLHHLKARAQWAVSDGLYKIGEVLEYMGKIKDPADVFDFSLDELESYLQKPLLGMSVPEEVSLYTIDEKQAKRIDQTVEVELGKEVRIEAKVLLADTAIRQAINSAENPETMAGKISEFFDVYVLSNLNENIEKSQKMKFTGFDGHYLTYQTVVRPKLSGTRYYSIGGRTIFQEQPVSTQKGKIIVSRKEEEKIKIDLNGVDKMLDDDKNRRKILDLVKKAAGSVLGWEAEKKLGYRLLPEQPQKLLDEIKEHVKDRINAGVKDVVLIGMGGQVSPNSMMQKALKSELYNEFPEFRINCPRIHFLDNLDEAVLSEYLNSKGLDPETTDICIHSKSGNTPETLMNAYYLLNWMKKGMHERNPDLKDIDEKLYEHIVVISNDKTDGIGTLNKFFKNKNVKKWYIPTIGYDVGGRFTTLSPSGLITAAYSGLDIERLLEGAGQMKKTLDGACIEEVFGKNDSTDMEMIKRNTALKAALFAYWELKEKGNDILVLATFSSKLREAANYLRQLIGESLAKDGMGPYPIIATGEDTIKDAVKNTEKKLFFTFNYLAEKELIPNVSPHSSVSFNLPQLDEYTLGELVYFFEEFVLWYGALLGIDPLVQPNVEKAKNISREKLEEINGEEFEKIDGENIELVDDGIYKPQDSKPGAKYVHEKDVESVTSYLGKKKEAGPGKTEDMEDGTDKLISTIETHYKEVIRDNGYKKCVVLGNREHILKMRAIYEAFYREKKNKELKYDVEFVDDTRKERLEEFLKCADPKETIALIVTGKKELYPVGTNFEKIMSFMKRHPGNVIFTSDTAKEQIPETILSYVSNSKSFFPDNEKIAEYLSRNGLTEAEITALILFGIKGEEIKSYMNGYSDENATLDISRKLAAYSYLLYQNNPQDFCNVDMVFSYSTRFSFFNSWAKHLFWSKFADLKRGPVIDSSIGSTDQHSILEGMLGWKNNIFTIFINVGDTSTRIGPVNKDNELSGLVPEYVWGRNPSEVLYQMHAGVSGAFTEEGRPNVTLQLAQLNYKNLGILMSIFEKMTSYEKILFERDIKGGIRKEVKSTETILREYIENKNIELDRIDSDVYYHYGIIRQLYGHNDPAALKAILNEMEKTGRSFREIVCGIVDMKDEAVKSDKNKGKLTANAVYIGGGGFGACSISKGIMRFLSSLQPQVRKKLPAYSVATITTAYDDWGNSRQLMDMFLKFWRTYVPAMGDPAAIISWATIGDEDWFDRERPDSFKPEKKNPKMDLLYSNDTRITLTKEVDTIEKYILGRILEINERFKTGDLKRPDDWLFFVANILEIAKLFDRKFVKGGKMKFDRISGQNLLTLGGLIDDGYLREKSKMQGAPNLEKTMEIMGVKDAYVVPVTFAQESQGASIVGHLDDERKTKIMGQYHLTTMEPQENNQRVAYITFDKVSKNHQAQEIGRAEFDIDELPEISPQARELIENANYVIVSGAGSIFTSITANLLTRGVVDALEARKGQVPRVLILPVMEAPETANHNVASLIQAVERSVQVTFEKLGRSDFKLSDIFDYVIIPDVKGDNNDIEERYKRLLKEDRPKYLNDKGKRLFAEIDTESPKAYEKMMEIVRNEDYQNEDTIKGLAYGQPKLDKIMPSRPFPVNIQEDSRILKEMGLKAIVVDKPSGFFLWEGKIHYVPDYLVNKIHEARIDFELEKFSKIPGFNENFEILVDILGGEKRKKEKAFSEIEKEALLLGKTIPEIVCGNIAEKNAAEETPEREIKNIDHLSFGGGGWSNCSLMRAMEEMEDVDDGQLRAAHLVPTVDNGGSGRVMGDEVRKNIGMYVPIFGDFAGVVSWLTGKWDKEKTFSDINVYGAKMALLYGMDKKKGDYKDFGRLGKPDGKGNDQNIERLLREMVRRIKFIQKEINAGKYEMPDDWILFVSNMINLAKFLDERLIEHKKLVLKNSSTQNIMYFSAMLNSIDDPARSDKGEIVQAKLNENKNFAERLLRSLGIKNVGVQFQTYDPLCIVAVLEGTVLKFGEDAVILKQEDNRVYAKVVKKDHSGNFVTTAISSADADDGIGSYEFNLENVSLRVNKLSEENNITIDVFKKSEKDGLVIGQQLVFTLRLTEDKEGETVVKYDNLEMKASTDATWTDFSHKDIDFSIMSRRIEGQFDIAMEEHVSRINKLSLKAMRPKRDREDKIVTIRGGKKDGWIDYDVFDDNANVNATKWADAYIEKTTKTIRFDSGGVLTQTAALMNKDIVAGLMQKKDVPRIYIPPLMTDVIISGLSLKDLVQVMERSMKGAIGDSSVSFEKVFSHVIVPEVPEDIQKEYLKEVKQKAKANVNKKGEKELVNAETVNDIRSILSDTSNLSENVLEEFAKDPGKIKAKMKKMLPSTLLEITQEDFQFLKDKGIEIVKVRDLKYFGIWENKIVYEPRNLRDLIIELGEDHAEIIEEEKDIKGENAGDADNIIPELIRDNNIMEVSIDPETQGIEAYMVRPVEEYSAGRTDLSEYRGETMDLLKTLEREQIFNILSWIWKHKVGSKLLKFRIVLGEPVLSWKDNINHSNIAHAGVKDGVIYIGEGLFRFIFSDGSYSEGLRKEILDDDEYMHHLKKGHGSKADVERRLNMVDYKIDDLKEMIVPIGRKKTEMSKKAKEAENNMEKLHTMNLDLIPEYSTNKIVWHIIQLDLIPEFIRSDFVNLVRKLDRDYPDINEKIKIVSKDNIPIFVNELLGEKDRVNMINVAVTDADSLKQLPDGVKGLVFNGKVGEFSQLEGVIAALRALNKCDVSALKNIYMIMTGDIMEENDSEILKYIDNAEKLSEFMQFTLLPIEGLDYDELKLLNERLLKFIVAA